MATVETQIPLTEKWSADEVEQYDNVTLIDIDKHLKSRGLRYLSVGRKIVSRVLRSSLICPNEDDVYDATSAIDEIFTNTCQHGESPILARITVVDQVAFLDTANKIACEDSEFCAGLGDHLVEATLGKGCIERIEDGDMCYTRVPIDLREPVKQRCIEVPTWSELE